VAPDARPNRDFSAALGKALHRPVWLPVPSLALRLALGEFAQTLTTGQHVSPTKLQALGYQFQYPQRELALSNLLKPSS
jgi:NAD dependent epimerase/dehydratase family enzyme